MTTIRTFTASAALAAAALLCPGAAQAASGSLVYAKGGDVELAAPDGSRAARLTTDGGYAWPSQADDGTIVAVRQTQEGDRTPRRLHRLGRDGTPLGAPVVTVPVDNSYYIGPLAPKVSPDGRFVAYHYFYTGPIVDDVKPRIAISHSDRDTVNGEITSTLGGYFTPSWLQDGRLLAFHAAERTLQVDIWNPGDSVTNWFGDPDVAPLLTDGEVTRAGDRLAAVANNTIRLYDVPGGPPAVPQHRCTISGFNGDASDPTWSPEGDALAWEEADGIHVAALPDLGACGTAARPLVVAGGEDPDWGPAAPAGGGAPGPGTVPPPAGERLTVALSGWRRSVGARSRIRGTARCSAACSLTATLTVNGKTARRLHLKGTRLARTTGRAATGSATLTLRLSKPVARRVRRTTAQLKVTATAGGARATATRRVRLVSAAGRGGR